MAGELFDFPQVEQVTGLARGKSCSTRGLTAYCNPRFSSLQAFKPALYHHHLQISVG
jgi:hypothetical protein